MADVVVRVNNTRPTMLHLPPKVNFGEDKEGHVKLLGATQDQGLIPGGNNIAKAIWDNAKKNKTIQQWIDIGWITEGGDTKAPEGPEAPKTLTGYGSTTAVALIDDEDNHEVLKTWSKHESRPEVKTVLAKKVEQIESSSKKKSKG